LAPPQGLFLEEVHYPEQLMDPDFIPVDNPDDAPVIAPIIPPGGDTP